mmetsp:Transcript_13884/g.29971  ORF Transcript_13884/g.29971 Transcript_13884/m.29971 type:complete len:242 (-) Transcript_13884:82-807(-)
MATASNTATVKKNTVALLLVLSTTLSEHQQLLQTTAVHLPCTWVLCCTCAPYWALKDSLASGPSLTVRASGAGRPPSAIRYEVGLWSRNMVRRSSTTCIVPQFVLPSRTVTASGGTAAALTARVLLPPRPAGPPRSSSSSLPGGSSRSGSAASSGPGLGNAEVQGATFVRTIFSSKAPICLSSAPAAVSAPCCCCCWWWCTSNRTSSNTPPARSSRQATMARRLAGHMRGTTSFCSTTDVT